MRPSRVPVRSLYRHGLLFDPGGLYHGSPLTPRQMLRSGTLKPSAFTRSVATDDTHALAIP